MWRRICTSQLKALAQSSYRAASVNPSIARTTNRSLISPPIVTSRLFNSQPDTSVTKKVEDVMPIATGHEREELEAELEGKKLLDINFPEGPFGTKA